MGRLRGALIGTVLIFPLLLGAAQEQGAPPAARKTMFERNTQPIEI